MNEIDTTMSDARRPHTLSAHNRLSLGRPALGLRLSRPGKARLGSLAKQNGSGSSGVEAWQPDEGRPTTPACPPRPRPAGAPTTHSDGHAADAVAAMPTDAREAVATPRRQAAIARTCSKVACAGPLAYAGPLALINTLASGHYS